jgi:NADH-quinone oxidoreductase subunit N
MNIGAFVLVSVLESNGQAGDLITSYRGLFYRNPVLAGFTAVFMFSLAGFPPTAGFFAKYLAFSAAVKAGHTDLVVVGVLTSLVSIFYYLRVVVVMLLPATAEEGEEAAVPTGADIAGSVAAAGAIALGILPTGLFNLATQSVDAIRTAFRF